MLIRSRLLLVAACILVLSPPLIADDAILASKLIGNWEGTWKKPEAQVVLAGGMVLRDENTTSRMTCTFSALKGNSLKVETTYFGTSNGVIKERSIKAIVQDGKLKVHAQFIDFEATISEDGNSLDGAYTSIASSGKLALKKKVE